MSPEENGNSEQESQEIRTNTGAPAATYYYEATEMIIASKSKLLVWLGRIKKNLRERQGWKYPLCLLLPLLFSMVTCTFTNFLLRADVWKTIWFIILGIIGVWLFVALYQSLKSKTDEHLLEILTKDMVVSQDHPTSTWQ